MIIAHRLSTIEKCNKVIVLEAGRVLEYGQYNEVSQSEAFRRNFMIEGII
jgi:ABC-type multidrug transport system fused ATPase/permease subunit